VKILCENDYLKIEEIEESDVGRQDLLVTRKDVGRILISPQKGKGYCISEFHFSGELTVLGPAVNPGRYPVRI
jgi:hypothetical protein